MSRRSMEMRRSSANLRSFEQRYCQLAIAARTELYAILITNHTQARVRWPKAALQSAL
jgi:hypothetical protein